MPVSLVSPCLLSSSTNGYGCTTPPLYSSYTILTLRTRSFFPSGDGIYYNCVVEYIDGHDE